MTRTPSRIPTVERRRARLTAEERKALLTTVKKRYDAGASIWAIAVEIRRSYGFVHRLLDKAGVPQRPRGKQPKLATATGPLPAGTAIRDFAEGDRGAVITLIADAFAASGTGRWLDPNPSTRRWYALRRATAVVDGALAHGSVRVANSDGIPVAVALWVRYPTGGHSTDPLTGYSDADILDPEMRKRAEELDRLLRQRRRGAPWEHLAGLGVHPGWQNDGLRTYLLTDRHHTLAQHGPPTCLDVDNARLRRWCREHGYRDIDIGDPITLPGTDTRIWPMRRRPAAVENCAF